MNVIMLCATILFATNGFLGAKDSDSDKNAKRKDPDYVPSSEDPVENPELLNPGPHKKKKSKTVSFRDVRNFQVTTPAVQNA